MEEYDADTLIDGIWFDTGSTIKRDYERGGKDCWEALHLSHFKAIEETLDKMSFWQVVKIILKGGLKEIFAPQSFL